MDTAIFQRDFGINFRRIRKSKKMTQDDVAERAGLSSSYISNVERGVANPRLKTVSKLANALGVSPIELFHVEAGNASPEEIRQRLQTAFENINDVSLENFYQAFLGAVSQ